ncbi:unnamed protein product [Phyllotreta striolata]|uniref:Uncharacterized protein n=1 Tax=Phyllotreta striolata TaxID=444603 RepID=A0A9P0GUX7_PHYSR|nr:unnamed protein product [Phyllotreta striolata]
MSVILLTQHDENIYDIFKGQETKGKQIKLRFKTAEDEVKIEYPELYAEKKKYGVMGVAGLEIPDPHNFLKKGTGKPCYVQPRGEKEPTRPCMPNRRPEVPKTREVVKLYNPPKKDKDFVVKNISKVKGQPGKEHEHYIVLDKHGNKESVKVLEPVYVKMPPFGKTPPYLKMFLREREIEYQKKREAKVTIQPICKYVTRHRRKELLDVSTYNDILKYFGGIICCLSLGFEAELGRAAKPVPRPVHLHGHSAEDTAKKEAGDPTEAARKGHSADRKAPLHLRVRG